MAKDIKKRDTQHAIYTNKLAVNAPISDSRCHFNIIIGRIQKFIFTSDEIAKLEF